MARLRYNGLATTLGADLAAGDTTITFSGPLAHSGGTAVPTIGAGDYIPLAILDTDGALTEIVNLTAYATGATTGTIARAQESTTAAAHTTGDAVINSATTADFGGGGGLLLASGSYNPASLVTLSTASTTFVDVDPALAVTFTAPASGQVLVVLTAVAAVSTATAAGYWNLRTSSGDVAGTSRFVTGNNVSDIKSVFLKMTGLTSGTSYTYKWGYRIHSSSFTTQLSAGGEFGPASMFIWLA